VLVYISGRSGEKANSQHCPVALFIQCNDTIIYALQAPVEDTAADRMLGVKLWKYIKFIKKLEDSTKNAISPGRKFG
jgi:hypothetical protein